MRAGRMLVVAGVALAMGLPAVMGADDGARKTRTIRGQVIEMREIATANQGTLSEIKVRTRQREEVWLRLGPLAGNGDSFRVGDQVRARVREGDGGPATVRNVWNQTTDQVLAARADDAQFLQDRDRLRIHDRTGDRLRLDVPDRDQVRQRDRISRPGGSGTQTGHRRGVKD